MIHYQYVSVPIPTTPQAIRPLVEKPNTASTATPFILPIEANESHRGQSTVHWQGAAHIVSRSIEHWQRLHRPYHCAIMTTIQNYSGIRPATTRSPNSLGDSKEPHMTIAATYESEHYRIKPHPTVEWFVIIIYPNQQS